jgi:hypothetical protein
MRVLAVVLLVIGVALPPVVWAATALSGLRPWMAERVLVSSTTDWVVYTPPAWARQCLIRNEHASATMYVGRYDETGAFSAVNDEYITLPAGSAVTIPLSSGQSAAPSDHLAVPIASASASHPVGWFCTESAQ